MRNDAPDLLLGVARNVLRREVSRVIASDFSHIAAELKRIETEKAKVLAAKPDEPAVSTMYESTSTGWYAYDYDPA